MQTKAVLFDMDGLVFDTEFIMYQAYVSFCQRKHLHYEFDLFKQLLGLNRLDGKAVIDMYYAGTIDYDELFTYGAAFRQNYIIEHGLPIKKGFFQLLAYCQRQNIKTALVSSSKLSVIESNLKASSLWKTFDLLVSGEQVIHSKPSPEIFNLALEKLKLLPKEALVLEDSENGIKAAHNAHIDCICVPDLVNHSAQINALCVAVVPTLDKVIGYIK